MTRQKQQRKNAFSLLEVVIVVAIIAILAAIGIPRMSRGSRGAGDSALKANLAVLRNAIDLYAAEHQGSYPTQSGVADQLTKATNDAGTTGTSKSDGYIYGPYLRKIPPLPVGDNKGNTGISSADGNGVGWIYTAGTGEITANCAAAETDDQGIAYSDPNYY